jgi:hypothetical protein
MAESFDRQDYIVDVEWRWTSAPATVVGLHPSVLLGIPLVFATLLATWAILAWGLYVVLVVVLKMRTNLSPFEYLQMKLLKLMTGNRWSVR